MLTAEKPLMKGKEFHQPLQFGDWPWEKLEPIIAETKAKYSNSDDFELVTIDRGAYQKCQGYGDHGPCNELQQTYGKIVFRRKGTR